MAQLVRLEVWSDFQCAGGTRQSIIPVDACTRLETTERAARDDDGVLELSLDAPGASALAAGAAVRFLFDDASFTEWRITELTDTSRTSRLVRAQLQSPLLDLNVRNGPITTTTSNVTTLNVAYGVKSPTEHATAIMSFAPAWFTVGTITPTVLVDLSFSGAFPLEALRRLVSAIRDAGVDCELDYRRNGTTGYYVDLVTSIGASASALDVRTAKNLMQTDRSRSIVQQAGTVIVEGASGTRRSGITSTMALAFWNVASVSGSDIELRGVEGCPDPIEYDSQFNGCYLQKTDGTYTQITATTKATQKVTVASVASISANQWLRLVRNASGDDLFSVSNPTAAAPLNQATILSLPSRSDRTNWVSNPTLSRWSAGNPVDWTETDASGYLTVTEDTTRYQFGARSAKFSFVAPGGTLANARLTSRTFSVAPSATSRTFVATAWIYFDNAATSFVSTPTVRLSLGGTNTDTLWTSATPNSWNRISVTATMTGATVNAYVEIRMASTTALTVVINLGGLIIEELATPPTTMVIGSDPAFSLAAANRRLRLYSSIPSAYKCAFINLEQWDPTAWPYDGVTLGQVANVRDTDLGVTTSARVLELTRNWKNPLASILTAATRPPDLVTLLSGIG